MNLAAPCPEVPVSLRGLRLLRQLRRAATYRPLGCDSRRSAVFRIGKLTLCAQTCAWVFQEAAIQRGLGSNRLIASVSQADVILTDISGLAVAIQYDPDTMSAPTVLAKGSGTIGKQIRETASQRHIAVVENSKLSQMLYRNAAINRPIPAEHYAAVAEILTEVYQQDEMQ